MMLMGKHVLVLLVLTIAFPFCIPWSQWARGSRGQYSTTSLHARMLDKGTNPATSLTVAVQVSNWLHADRDPFSDSIETLMGLFDNDRKLPQNLVMNILNASIAAHKQLPNVIKVTRTQTFIGTEDELCVVGNVTVVGDTHGQYDDFAQIFRNATIGGYPSEQNQFVFNGDIVDRGPQAVEIMMVLLFAKLLSPNAVHILRGNHETAYCTSTYGFQREVESKYDAEVYNKFLEYFDTMPFAAVIENEVLVVHGGLGDLASAATLEEINQVDRFNGTPNLGLIDGMLWSDPDPKVMGLQRDFRPRFGADNLKQSETPSALS